MTGPVFIDTETTSLRPDRRAWEIALADPDHPLARDGADPVTLTWMIEAADLDLGNADPFSLKIGGFYERHPQYAATHLTDGPGPFREREALEQIERATRGRHLCGNVVSFDAEVLAARMRAHGIAPSWHYHLIDIEAMAVGFLRGHFGSVFAEVLPWDSEVLSAAFGVDPAQFDRHTALGDARWAMAEWDAMHSGDPLSFDRDAGARALVAMRAPERP